MPERLTFRLPERVELDEAALVEPASIGLYGLSGPGIGPGQNLLVVGTGPLAWAAWPVPRAWAWEP